MQTYKEAIVTNYHTLPYFKENFKSSLDFKLKEALTLLSGGKFLLVGSFDEIPVFAYETWHDDNHFVMHLRDVVITDDQIASENPGSEAEKWDTYLVLH